MNTCDIAIPGCPLQFSSSRNTPKCDTFTSAYLSVGGSYLVICWPHNRQITERWSKEVRNLVWAWKFSQRFCWRFISSGMLRCVEW